MSEATANKLVAFFMVGGVAYALVRKKNSDASTTYRRVWGVTVLGLGGAALAGFAPQVVGPYFLLVIIAYISGNLSGISKGVSGLKSQAGVSK